MRESIPAAPPAGQAAALVKVKEWDNQTVHVWSITSEQHAAFNRETRRRQKRDPDKVRVPERMLILCLRNEHGVPHFTDDDEDFLAKQPVAVISRLFRICARHNGFTDDEVDDAANP